MQIVHVHIHVKDDWIQAFIEATLENAQNSILEPGIARFDLIQKEEDISRFILVEVYRNKDAPIEHKATGHYKKWKNAVDGMMAEPRVGEKYAPLFLKDE